MESEESRPGSSASNSSSDSSENSRRSSVTPTRDEGVPQSHAPHSPSTHQSSPGIRSRSPTRSRSRSSNVDTRSRSPSKSDSESSSSSSSIENENEPENEGEIEGNGNDRENNEDEGNHGPKSPAPIGEDPKLKSPLGRSNSCDGTQNKSHLSGSPAQSFASSKSRRSSRNSNSSSAHSQSRSRSNSREFNRADRELKISHDDLSDVSDMESEKRNSFNNSKQSMEDEGTNASATAVAAPAEQQDNENGNGVITDLRQKLDQRKHRTITTDSKKNYDSDTGASRNGDAGACIEDLVKSHDEDALDFEAEEGECQEASKDEKITADKDEEGEKPKATTAKSDGEAEDGEELEEGEVSDEDEKRPEETEPKPVCRFYTRGQCTWGMSCRFLHPGVTDKGNYTMFDLVRPVPLPSGGGGGRGSGFGAHSSDYHDYRTERPPLHHRPVLHHTVAPAFPVHHEPRSLVPEGPVVVESAWERGLRTAKEMMRKANKRKEQDMDFEDKKMNLTLSPDELEKDAYYLKDRSPEVVPPYGRHAPYPEVTYSSTVPSVRGHLPPYDDVDPYGRTPRYRELPPHRMPQYEDERRIRPTREVIVQRVEPPGRGDEWSDPWMRSKSPGARGSPRERGEKKRPDRRSYSSHSTYSSSSSSQSESSSDSSQSPSPANHKRRAYKNSAHKTASPARRHAVRPGRSPTSPVRRPRRSPTARHSPPPKHRGHTSPAMVVDKRSVHSPTHKRKKISPPPKKVVVDKASKKRRHASSSSASGSSDSSESDSESESGSSSSESSSRSRGRTSRKRLRVTDKLVNERKSAKKDPPKKRSPISIELKKQTMVGTSALLSPPPQSAPSEKDPKKTRREELLKQLRAVEDAIAKKRSKLS